MPIQNLKLPKNYRDTASDFYIKVGIGLIAVLVVLNVTLVILFFKETKLNRNAQQTLQETNKALVLLQESLGKMDMQRAFVHLADARRQVATALPPAPTPAAAKPVAETAAQPAKQPAGEQKTAAVQAKVEQKQPAVQAKQEQKQPIAQVKPEQKPPVAQTKPEQKPPAAQVKPVEFKIPAGETPMPLAWAPPGEYALIGEKATKLLHLFKFQDEHFVLVKSYSCIIGANGDDKKKAGDFATPKGSYFTLRYTSGNALPEIYGEGAFILNYPNFLDRKSSKNGTGIWVHGHVPGKVIGMGDLLNTKGCIAASNDNIKELKDLLKPSGTHVSIVDRIAFVKETSQKESLQEVRNFMEGWRRAWESGDTAKYLAYYSKDFINSEGMNYDAFKRHKERVNSGKKFIRVNTDQMAIFFPQEREGQVAVVRFIQKYRSNNFESSSKKLFYIKKGRGGWIIFGESAF